MGKFKIVQISTPWCGPCKVAKKTLTAAAASLGKTEYYEYLDETVDMERFQTLAIKHKVRSVPRFIVVDSNDNFLDDLGGSLKGAVSILENIKSS